MGSPLAAAAFLRYSISRENPADGSARMFDTAALRGIYDIRADRGRLQCKLKVTPDKQNRMGNLHGGCIATLIDVVGTAALLTVNHRGGVSLNITTNYLEAMPGEVTVAKKEEQNIIGNSENNTQKNSQNNNSNFNTNKFSVSSGDGADQEQGVVLVDAVVVRVGKRIAVINVDLYNSQNGVLCSSGTHVKYISEKEPDLSEIARMVTGEAPLPPLTKEEIRLRGGKGSEVVGKLPRSRL